jgi:hypothetical protein
MAEMTVMDEIIGEVAEELYKKWVSAMPEDEKNQQAFSAMTKNAHETTLFVIQNFMNKFNAAAEELKDK